MISSCMFFGKRIVCVQLEGADTVAWVASPPVWFVVAVYTLSVLHRVWKTCIFLWRFEGYSG